MSYSLNVYVILWLCSSGHMTSIVLSILERDPRLLLYWRVLTFFPWMIFYYFLGVFFLIRCEVKGQGCRTCTDCKALRGEFVICDFGLYKINWIENLVFLLSSLLLLPSSLCSLPPSVTSVLNGQHDLLWGRWTGATRIWEQRPNNTSSPPPAPSLARLLTTCSFQSHVSLFCVSDWNYNLDRN